MYVRNLRKPSPTKNVIKFSSPKNNDMILCESRLEFDACFHLEYSKDVISFSSQPTGFYYELDGKNNPYTPDFLVHLRDGSRQYWEVKPRHVAQKPEFQLKFMAQQSAAIALGETLNLVTSRQIRLNPILNNLKLMHAYHGFYQITKLQTDIIALVWRLGTVPLQGVALELDLPLAEAKSSVLPLLAKGELVADLKSAVFGTETVLTVG